MGDDEIESESLSLSSGSSTQQIQSGELSNSSHQQIERNRNRSSPNKKKSDLSGRRNDRHNMGQLSTSHQEYQFVISTGRLVLLMILFGVFSYLNETVFFSSHNGISESCSVKINADAQPKSFDSTSPQTLSFFKIADNFVIVQPEEVKCYGWITFLSLQFKIFWNSCINSEQLFSNEFLHKTPLSLSLQNNKKKWSYKAESVNFQIRLLDPAKIEGLIVILQEFQLQYYLRHNLTLELYGNYLLHEEDSRQYQNIKQNSILLFDEKLTAQHLVKIDGDVLGLVYIFQSREKFSSLSFRLRSKSSTIILHQLIGISILEKKTYERAS